MLTIMQCLATSQKTKGLEKLLKKKGIMVAQERRKTKHTKNSLKGNNLSRKKIIKKVAKKVVPKSIKKGKAAKRKTKTAKGGWGGPRRKG